MLDAKDPYILLSAVNMKLRDEESDLTALCKTYDKDEKALVEKLKSIGYEYDKAHHQFVAQ